MKLISKNVLKLVWKTVAYSIGVVLFLSVVFAGLTQSKLFKDRLRILLISTITANTEATMSLGTIRGNFVTGFSIDSVRIHVGEREFLRTGTITIDYDFFSLPRQRIVVNRLVIENPRVDLHRNGTDSLWNIDKLIKPSGQDEPAPFDWTIRIHELRLIGGRVIFKDDVALASPDHAPPDQGQVEYHDFSLVNVNLTCRGAYGGKQAKLDIGHLSFQSLQPAFELRDLRGEFTVSPTGTEAKSLFIETRRTRLELSAVLREVNLFDGIELEELRDKATEVNLVADQISLNELKSFLAPVDFLNGSTYLELEASGEFGDLVLHRLNLQTQNTAIRLAGAIRNLHTPDNLFIDVNFQESRLTPGDAGTILPTFHIPPFELVGPCTLRGSFTGKPLNFTANLQLSGDLGSIQTEAQLNLEQEKIAYDCAFSTHNLNIKKVFSASPVRTSLTSHGTFRGTGSSQDDIAAHLKVILDSSMVENMLLTGSDIVLNVQDHALQTSATLGAPETNIAITGRAEFLPGQRPLVQFGADVTNLDLAALLSESHFKSRISFTTDAVVRGSNIDNLRGTLTLAFGPSSFQTYEFGGHKSELNINLENPDSQYISVRSPIADITMSGKYTLSRMVDLLRHEFDKIVQVVNARTELFQQARSPSSGPMIPVAAADSTSTTDLQYHAFIKNLRPLSVFLGGTPFNGRGTAFGTVRFNHNTFSVSCSTSTDEIFVGTLDKGTFFEDGKLTFTLTSEEEPAKRSQAEHLTFSLAAFSRYGVINKNRFDNPAVQLSFDGDSARYEIHSTIDSLFVVDMIGNLAATARAYELTIDTVTMAFGTLFWTNDGHAALRVDRNGVAISGFNLRKDDETFALHGKLDFEGNLESRLSVRKFDLRGLGQYMKMPQLDEDRGFRGKFELDAELAGTLDAPLLLLRTAGEQITYRGREIGTVAGSMKYREESLEVELGIGRKRQGATRPNDLYIRGTIPVNLGLGSVENRFPDKPMKLVMDLRDFNIDFLDPLLVTFDDFHGKLSSTIEVGGTPVAPRYSGTISFSDVQFVFVPNNLSYSLSGKLEASGDKLHLFDVRIANDRRDRNDGVATVGGSLTIRNFTVDHFDLFAHGQLALMKETTRKTRREMYGTLFASIGSDGLRYRGSFEESYLSGTVLVKEATLVFPPTRESASTVETSLNYFVVDDTTTYDPSRRRLSEEFFAEQADGNGTMLSSIPARTIWDGMQYDVLIETQGTTEIRMVFNQATNEELFAALDGRLILQRREGAARIIGEIAVGERSYYNFFKKFSARGTLKFVGAPDNPELNITALYESIRVRPDTVTDDNGQKQEERVVVTLDITGTRYEPQLRMSMTVDGKDWAQGDVQSDAIPFILTGKFRDELTSEEKSDILTGLGSTAGSSLLYGLPTQMLSGLLSDFLRDEFGFIRTAEIIYTGGNIQESADLRLSGELGRAYWRFGGKIFNDIGNANVSFQLSMGEVFTAPKLNNLFIELERKVEASESVEFRKLTNAARIFYRISF